MKDIQSFLKENKIVQDIKKDQYFLADEKVVRRLCEVAGVTKKDRVLEVGPGLGMVTRLLAVRAREVIAIEIDLKFKRILKTLPKNVEVIFGNAYELLNDKKFLKKTRPPTKVIANIPYSQAQNMLHNYTNYSWYQGDLVWLAPASLARKVNEEPILGAYFMAEIMEMVPKTAFYPQPKTSSAIIRFKRIPDPKKTKDFAIYFRRFLYNHENLKVKNALREALIHAAWDLKKAKLTKNQARELVLGLSIPPEELEKLTNNIKPKYYFDIPQKFFGWFENLQ